VHLKLKGKMFYIHAINFLKCKKKLIDIDLHLTFAQMFNKNYPSIYIMLIIW
jgi:hypothetical protein